jgi:predicted dehydrogenase
MAKLRVAFVGAGRIADLHARAYKDFDKASIYAVCDVREDVAKRRAAEWSAERWYTNYEQLLSDPKVDAVEILTPHFLHANQAIAALQAGKHVSLQKPMAISMREADAIIDAAKSSKEHFRVFDNYRYYPPYIKVRELIQAGEIGEPLAIRTKQVWGNAKYGWPVPEESMSWRYDPTKVGANQLIMDYGHHVWFTVMWFMGDVESVFAWVDQSAERSRNVGARTTIVAWKHTTPGRVGSFESIGSTEMVVRSNYYTGEGFIEVSGTSGIVWVNRCEGVMLDVPAIVLYRDGRLTVLGDVETDWGVSFANGGRDFIESIINDRQAPITGEEGREVLRFIFAVLKAAKEGREVKLSEVIS